VLGVVVPVTPEMIRGIYNLSLAQEVAW
jgi:hypothetical protein